MNSGGKGANQAVAVAQLSAKRGYCTFIAKVGDDLFGRETAARTSLIALERWPTPVVISDFQYGMDCFAGRRIAESNAEGNPVADVFRGNIPSEKDIRAVWGL